MPRKAGRPSRQYLEDTKRMQEKRNLREVGMLTGGQAKIAAKAPPPNVINEKDFEVLRAEKAKGRGMGLQDESVKPGKVMKAKKGHFSKSNVSGHKRVMGVFPTIDKVPPTAKGKDLLKKNTTPLKALGKVATSRAGALGAILGAGAVGLNVAGRKLKKVLDERKARKRDEAKVKKMGGGMMQKPMGYSTGRSISTRGGGVDSSIIGKLRDAGPFKRIPLGKSRMTDEDRKKIRQLMEKRSSRKKALDTAKRVVSTVASAASPVTAAASAGYKLAKKLKNDGMRLTEKDIKTAKSVVGMGSKNRPIKKDHSSRNPNPKTPTMMGGGMMQKPMGYSKGIMVKARGCKLGRTRPTKIT